MALEISDELIDHVSSQLGDTITFHESLGMGEHNINLILHGAKGKYVLRIYANTQFDNAKQEQEILHALEGLYGPGFYLMDYTKTLLPYNYAILEYIKGDVLKELSDDDIQETASVFRAVHSIVDASQACPWDHPISESDRKQLVEHSKQIDEELHLQLVELDDTIQVELDAIKPLLSSYARTSLIHNDPIPANMVRTSDGIRFIDWELGCFDYFFLDLATFIVETSLDAAQEQLLLKSYGWGLNQDESKILSVCKHRRMLSIIAWNLERIVAIRSGGTIFEGQDEKKYLKMLNMTVNRLQLMVLGAQ